MSWITVIWSAASGMCLMLAAMHVPMGTSERRLWPNLCFTVMVFAVIGLGGCELMTLYADSPATFSKGISLGHLFNGIWVVGGLSFVHLSFGTGRGWLFVSAVGLRLAAVIANFTTGESLHFREVSGLSHVTFLGEPVAVVGEWVKNPWVRLGQVAALFQIIYVIDASVRLWSGGSAERRRQALLVGGSIVFFILVAAGHAGLVAAGITSGPLLVSFPFFALVLVIGYNMSFEVRKAARVMQDLQKSERRLALAASSARLALWEWHLGTDRIWVSENGREIYGVAVAEEIRFPAFIATVHEDDRSSVLDAVKKCIEEKSPFSAEYRVTLADGTIRWIAAAGRVEHDDYGGSELLRGVSMDVTARKLAELENARQNRELSHLSRVSLLGELAGSLAHELNQPLAAILSNAQVGRRILDRPSPDLVEMGLILDDVIADTKRAGGIVHGMRAMFKKESLPVLEALDLNGVIREVLGLLNGEVVARRTRVDFQPDAALPPVRASRIELQQVLINLILNGLDAVREAADGAGVSVLTKHENKNVIVIVRDEGPGISPEIENRLFEPFATTKEKGLGLGLSISRGIMIRFGGELESVREDGWSGAIFRITLPRA
jgi:two-component system, LuxR family, sensor kinase FixL